MKMTVLDTVSVLSDHSFATMVKGDGSVFALVSYSERDEAGRVRFGSEWQAVDNSSRQALRDWLGY